MGILAINKRANIDYDILEKYEAGLILQGHEVKSIKKGNINLKEGYITVVSKDNKNPELHLVNTHVGLYDKAGKMDHYNPYRPKKLLLNKKEIKHLVGKKQQAGLTLIPLKIYTKNDFIKVELGVVKGKKKHDKREAIKKKEVDRRIRTLTKKRLQRK